MSHDEIADKFRGYTDVAKWPKQKAEVVIEMVSSLDKLPDITQLIALLN